MDFHILTLFPEMVEQGLDNSILKRAKAENLISVNAVNIRDYSGNKHGSVDDYTYGGGAGMLMRCAPVFDAYEALPLKNREGARVIYADPKGVTFDQKKAGELSECDELVFICGHYEGIDQRVIDEIVTDRISIGDYILTGGELPVMVMIDSVSRLIPGVLGNDESSCDESFSDDLLEYPQYTRPEVWHDKTVPPVLLSGDHKKIEEWRLFEAIKETRLHRPDLYEKYKERIIKEEAPLKPKRRVVTNFINELEKD